MVRQYRHTSRRHAKFHSPAGTPATSKDTSRGARFASWKENAVCTLPPVRGCRSRSCVLLAAVRDEQVQHPRPCLADNQSWSPGPPPATRIEKYFDMSVIVMPFARPLPPSSTAIAEPRPSTALIAGPSGSRTAYHRRSLGRRGPSFDTTRRDPPTRQLWPRRDRPGAVRRLLLRRQPGI